MTKAKRGISRCLVGLIIVAAPLILSAEAIRISPAPRGFGGYGSPGLSDITPRMTISRTSGELPFVVHVSAMDTTTEGSQSPYDELEYTWNFGEPSTESFIHPVSGRVMRTRMDQRGPEAAYVYSRPGRYTITLVVRGWTGSRFIQRRTTIAVTALPWAGTDRYFDPDQGKDENDGTTVRTPWRSWDRLKAWIEGGNGRRAMLKRGTTMTARSSLTLRGTRIRVASYGKGARPIIQEDSSFPSEPLFNLWASNSAVTDHVYEGVELDGTLAAQPNILVHGYGSAGDGVSFRDIAFLKCRFTNKYGPGLVVYTGEGIFERMLFWGNEFDHNDGTGAGLGIFPGTARWLAVVGGSFTGGNGDMIRDHHIYPSSANNMLFRWINFAQAKAKNFCINTNAKQPQGTNYVLIDGVNCTGTMNGIDMSNSDNDSNGRFNQVILQSSAIHDTGSIGPQSNALLGYSVGRYTIRDNAFSGNRHREIGITDPSARLMIYRNRFSTEASQVFAPLATQTGVFTDNVVVSTATTGQPMAAHFSSLSFLIARNRYQFSNLQRPFKNLEDGSAKTFKEWQAAGFDVNGRTGDDY